ncbi:MULTISPECIES: hypothetical protein [Micromonospora]|uniref:Uncharacterized protein n=2 Tax=Micromonospora TaxID=1873 RepID=A0A9X0LE42_9ACTN|nr:MULTISPECIES: hypothetical protein [Micromonospora]AEB47688.1 hypothetical protein VAB18032_03020 [Micromonospora maris AB-18-032]KUJ46719.1 hypothetical protein ADL17_27985 [Micromonospora maris]MBL6278728.1 hypothetical protein [Micromonospora fiedleri]RUL93997.1 hypothetical protein EG812_10050 [Verrucosispora sp. FIM060022]WSK42953.1 hypothetical protein OG712_01810 [Micromonospora maris]
MRDTENTPRAQFPSGARGGGRPVGVGALGRLPVNERSYRRPVDPPGLEPAGGRDEESPGYVIHLPIKVTDLAAATTLAGRVATSLNFLPELDAGETEVSTADDQNNRHRVFCDLLLADRTRCPQPYDHRGPCGDLPTTPEPRPASEPSGGP